MKELALKSLCDVLAESLQEYHERLTAFHQLSVSVEAIEHFRKASDSEQKLVNELFYQLTSKSFESLMQEFFEQFKKQSAVLHLLTDTEKLAQQLKYGW